MSSTRSSGSNLSVRLLFATLILLAAATRGTSPDDSRASSHREAPLISEDPAADNTDLYAFRSPDKPNTLTIVSNWIPGEDPAAGPNYYTFSPRARYNIHIDRTGDGRPELTYRFRFRTKKGSLFLGRMTELADGMSILLEPGKE